MNISNLMRILPTALTGLVLSATIALVLSAASADVVDEPEMNNTLFKFGVNFFASSTGYFEVEGYDGVAPEIVMQVYGPLIS